MTICTQTKTKQSTTTIRLKVRLQKTYHFLDLAIVPAYIYVERVSFLFSSFSSLLSLSGAPTGLRLLGVGHRVTYEIKNRQPSVGLGEAATARQKKT